MHTGGEGERETRQIFRRREYSEKDDVSFEFREQFVFEANWVWGASCFQEYGGFESTRGSEDSSEAVQVSRAFRF